jgi:carbamoyl-phosphate synthase small subunit
MTGYQEILTDPSYAGQIVTLTYPHVGNVGLNTEDVESRRPFAAGLVIRDLPRVASNFRSQGGLEAYLTAHGIVGIADVDTRKLTRLLREKGCAERLHLGTGTATDAGRRTGDRARESGSLDGGPRSREGRELQGAVRSGRPVRGSSARATVGQATRAFTSSRTTSASSTTSCAF